MAIDIIEIDSSEATEYSAEINEWTIGLWWDDFREAGVEQCFLAIEGDKIVGFQTVNIDNQTIAIETKNDYQGRGIAYKLISESGSTTPEDNHNPEFWSKIASVFGDDDEDE